MTNALTYDADRNGRIIRWHWSPAEGDPVRIRPALLELMDQAKGSKLAGVDGPPRIADRQEIVMLGLAFRGGGGALYLTTEGAAVRRFYRRIAANEGCTPFKTKEGRAHD